MPDFKPYTTRYLDHALGLLGQAVYTPIADLDIRAWWSVEPLPYAQRQSGQERHLAVGDKWGDLFDCAWFHFTGQVPASAAGKKLVLLLDVNGEMCVFDEQGVPVRGLTSMASDYDFSLGRPGKRVLPFSERCQGGEVVDVWADAGCNDLFGKLKENGAVREASIAICRDEVRALFYDWEVLLDFLKVLPKESARYQQILTALQDASHALRDLTPEEVERARACLRPMLAKRGGDPSLHVSAIGHAHMDLGWLWPIRETVRKAARTFSTALALMQRYPDYVFGQSQPQQYLWMKERYPELYARIGERVREGRLEPQGAMWVEADTNVSGGEALVRQLLQGKRFFRSEFGAEVDTLWLPDVFGYSAAMPQLLRRAGVGYFMTQKMSWSQINKFPHQSFRWQGIDGSAVLAHMLPEETYNSSAAPRSVRKVEENYRDVGISEHALLLFGIGDGGGGPGEEHLERLDRLKNLAGLCPVVQEPSTAFFAKWKAAEPRLPTWVGELYLERHQGTLTTEARNKWYNRRMEQALREWEWAAVQDDAPYPAERLQEVWREVLLYQFHDILPGSSIKRVYDESVARYAALLAEANDGVAAADERLAAGVDTRGLAQPVLVRNSLSWERTEWLQVEGSWLQVTVPPMGYATIDASTAAEAPDVSASTEGLENDLLRVRFNADGSLASVWDKRHGREVLAAGEAGNRLAVYADHGDAWDFPMDYAERAPRYMALVSAVARVDGPRAMVTQTYRLGHSELVQDVVLTAGSPRLDFVTRLRWRETESMLRTSFPVAVLAEEATYEIQFGHIRRPTHRNTTWDLARDEVSGHKWADLSQGDYGVALLNDSKYGHKVKGHVLDLNLLRSVPYPNPRLVEDKDVQPGEPHHAFTDQCGHVLTYALYPHAGDPISGGVVQAGYALNMPLRAVEASVHEGAAPRTASFLSLDAPNIIVEAVKKAEDSDDLIVRLYESAGRGTRTRLRFGWPVAAVGETNLMEEPIAPLAWKGERADLTFGPCEIKTLQVTRGK